MRRVSSLFVILACLLACAPSTHLVRPARAAGPAFVQVAAARVASGTSASVSLSNVAAGDTLVAYTIRDSARSLALADSRGDSYATATGPLTWGNARAAQVSYAVAAGGSTTVTATLDASGSRSILLYVMEYSGVGALDAAAGQAGTGGTLSSGTLNTSVAGDLLVGAAVSDNTVTGGSAGYATRSTLSGNLTEDGIAGAPGAYSATASHNGSGWAMQLLAFRPAGAAPTPTSTSTTVPGATSTRTPPPTNTAQPTGTATPVSTPTGSAAYPLKVSANGRYLVDQRNAPFLLVGDSPQSIIGNLSLAQATTYLADRQAHGFNALWVNLLCDSYTACNADGTTQDGIAPFTTPGDLSTPNEAYFARADAMIRQAAQDGIVVILDPIETGGWLGTLNNNGTTKDYNYGVYLGNRYKSFPNIVWMSGNDFQSWDNPGDRAVVQAVASGIKSADPGHLQTAELNYQVSDTFQDPTWPPIAALDAAYTYAPTYAEVLTGYNRNQGPVFMVEANYEGENNTGHDPSTPLVLRKQEYWTLLSGGTGQLYGNHFTWQFAPGWQGNLDTTGTAQLGYATALFSPRAWYNLVPDQGHTLVTAGYGTFNGGGDVTGNDYLTAARTPDGTLAIAYMPTRRAITVDMAQMAGQTTARWYDPTTGTYTPAGTFANSGSMQFTPPGDNSGGDGDWVLILGT